jgi:hypothetical protein
MTLVFSSSSGAAGFGVARLGAAAPRLAAVFGAFAGVSQARRRDFGEIVMPIAGSAIAAAISFQLKPASRCFRTSGR